MNEDIEVIDSPLSQSYSADGHTLSIEIYRIPDTEWTLEIVNEQGTTTVWNTLFHTDQEALDEAFATLQAEGIASFVANANEQALKPKVKTMFRPSISVGEALTDPLSLAEQNELDRFLLLDVPNDEGMTLETLDGYLHAIAIGPETIMPSKWLPKVWGEEQAMMPPLDDPDQVQDVLGLIMRHFNSIISGFEQSPSWIAPIWDIRIQEDQELQDAQAWAHGFVQGVSLNRAAWQPLFDSPEGREWYAPIGLLGEDDYSEDQEVRVATPGQRDALAQQIETSLESIHDFWLPLRLAIHERETIKRQQPKVGRNDPCPCGSGKKYKKCCGSSTQPH
jgi:uncharacterized protein